MWTWVDRLIFDSQTWPRPGEQFQLLRGSIVPAGPRMALCDLNWTRSLYLRQAVAQIFDNPEYLAELPEVNAVEIVHAPGMRTTAILMAGWLGAQLQWKLQGAGTGGLRFTDRGEAEIALALREAPGRILGSVELKADAATFLVAHHEGSDFLHADIRLADGRECHYLMPGGRDDLVSLLSDELMSGGRHKVYLKAVTAIAAVL